MQRRARATKPTPPACAECARLKTEEEAAERQGDWSRASDCRVLLHRHWKAAGHGGEQ